MSMVSFAWNGERRTFAVYLPPNWWNLDPVRDGIGLPTILAIHGDGDNAQDFIAESGFAAMLRLGDNNSTSLTARAAPAHFLVIYPFAITLDGLLIGGEWNTRFHGAHVLPWREDDVGFLQECLVQRGELLIEPVAHPDHTGADQVDGREQLVRVRVR